MTVVPGCDDGDDEDDDENEDDDDDDGDDDHPWGSAQPPPRSMGVRPSRPLNPWGVRPGMTWHERRVEA